MNGTHCSQIANVGHFLFQVPLSEETIFCSQIGHLETYFGPFFYAFPCCSQIKVPFVNEANNRARSDLLGRVCLHVTVMNFAQ